MDTTKRHSTPVRWRLTASLLDPTALRATLAAADTTSGDSDTYPVPNSGCTVELHRQRGETDVIVEGPTRDEVATCARALGLDGTMTPIGDAGEHPRAGQPS